MLDLSFADTGLKVLGTFLGILVLFLLFYGLVRIGVAAFLRSFYETKIEFEERMKKYGRNRQEKDEAGSGKPPQGES